MGRLRIIGLLVAAAGTCGPPAAAARGDEPRPAKKVTAGDVLKDWKPKPAGRGKEFEATGGSPKDAPDVAAMSFRLAGWSFEEVWNFYADKCGVADRYQEKNILIATGRGK